MFERSGRWVPAHQGIIGNEDANTLANDYRISAPDSLQSQIEIHPATLRTFLRQSEQRRCNLQALAETSSHSGDRFAICGSTKSNFHARSSLPRILQCLFSRWRTGQVDSCGTYPRHLGYLNDPRCRFCHYPIETTTHLLTSCPGTAPWRALHSVSSLDTLRRDFPLNIISIAQFDAFIFRSLSDTFVSTPKIQDAIWLALQAILNTLPAPSSSLLSPTPTLSTTESNHGRRRLLVFGSSDQPSLKRQKRFHSPETVRS